MTQGKLLLLDLVFLGAWIILSGCNGIQQTPIQQDTSYPATLTGAPKADLADYVTNIWPQPNSIVDMEMYKKSINKLSPHVRGIRLELRMPEADLSFGDAPATAQDISLIIDDQKVSSDLLVLSRATEKTSVYDKEGNLLYVTDVGPYYLSWAPELSLGQHEVKLLVETDLGIVYVFEWQFTIFE